MPPKKGKKGKTINLSFDDSPDVQVDKRNKQEENSGEDLRDLKSTPVWGSREQNDKQNDSKARFTIPEEKLREGVAAGQVQGGFNNGHRTFQETIADTTKPAPPKEQPKRVVAAEQDQEHLFEDQRGYEQRGCGLNDQRGFNDQRGYDHRGYDQRDFNDQRSFDQTEYPAFGTEQSQVAGPEQQGSELFYNKTGGSSLQQPYPPQHLPPQQQWGAPLQQQQWSLPQQQQPFAPPTEYQQHEVAEAEEQGDEDLYDLSGDLVTETERLQVAEVGQDADEPFDDQRDLGQTETELPDTVEAEQEEEDHDLDPFGEREPVEEEPSDDQGGLVEHVEEASDQTQDENNDEARSPADDTTSPKPTEPSIVLLCDECDKRIEDAHMHCGVCDDGDYDLCIACVDDRGAYCSGGARGEHSMVWRFVSEMRKSPRGVLKNRGDADVRRLLSSREPRPYGSQQGKLKQTPVPKPEPIPPTARTSRPYSLGQPKSEAKDSNPTIKMIVNGNSYDFIANRKSLLSSNTSYFANNAREDTHSVSGRQCGLYVNFKGEQYSTDVIRQYSQWLYDGRLRLRQEPGPVTAANVAPTLNFLVRAHVFGEEIKDKHWLNDIMDAFIAVAKEAGTTTAPLELVHHVYEYGHKKSYMRRLLVHMEAFNLTEDEDVKAKFEGLPLDFTLEVLDVMVKARPARKEDWWTFLGQDLQSYHAKF